MTAAQEPIDRARIQEILADLLADWPGAEPTEVVPGLWQGGTDFDHPHGVALGASEEFDYDLVVTLFDGAPDAPPQVEEVRYAIEDAELDASDLHQLLAIARHAHRRWAEGGKVLVRCQAGVNRSGMVTALILMESGVPAAAAIATVREARGPMVLSNYSFEQALLGLY